MTNHAPNVDRSSTTETINAVQLVIDRTHAQRVCLPVLLPLSMLVMKVLTQMHLTNLN
jgi:hypothetical protein